MVRILLLEFLYNDGIAIDDLRENREKLALEIRSLTGDCKCAERVQGNHSFQTESWRFIIHHLLNHDLLAFLKLSHMKVPLSNRILTSAQVKHIEQREYRHFGHGILHHIQVLSQQF